MKKKKEEKSEVETTYEVDELIEIEPVGEEKVIERSTGSFYENGKYGYKINNKVVVEPKYDRLWEMNDVLFVQSDGKQGVVSRSDEVLVPLRYSRVSLIEEADSLLFKVRIGTSYGVVSSYDKEILPVSYQRITYRYGFFLVSEDEGNAVFSLEGKQLTEFGYRSFFELNSSHGYYGLQKASDSSYTILKRNQDTIIFDAPKIYGVGYFDYFNQTLKHPKNYEDWERPPYIIIQNKAQKFGVYSFAADSFMISPTYDDCFGENNLNFIFEKSGKRGIVSLDNKVKVDFLYDKLLFDQQNEAYLGKTAIASINDSMGLVNAENGKVLTPFKYVEIKSIYEGKYKARDENGLYVVLSENGEILNPGPFVEVGEFALGKAMAFTKHGVKMLNLDGILTYNEFEAHKGYMNPDDVLEGFKEAMYASDNELLMSFCQKLAPSMHIIKFMDRIGISYKSFPQSVLLGRKTTAEIVQTYYDNLKPIKEKYFRGQKPDVVMELNYSLDPKIRNSAKAGRSYIEMDIKMIIDGDQATVEFDHCFIMEGFIISFSNSAQY